MSRVYQLYFHNKKNLLDYLNDNHSDSTIINIVRVQGNIVPCRLTIKEEGEAT